MLNNNRWNEIYQLAVDYYHTHGNLNIPKDYVINDIKLGKWLVLQRYLYSSDNLSSERASLLEDIHVIWNMIDEDWNQNYLEAKKYYELNGNLAIPYDYVVNDFNLGAWIHYQRCTYNQGILIDSRVELLNKIGMIWNYYDYVWEQYYNLAQTYYNHYGNLKIKNKFKTLDGITYCEEGLPLGVWLRDQKYFRNNNKLYPDREEKLNNIGIVWKTRVNRDIINNICKTYGIDLEKNKENYKRTVPALFQAKIDYLLSIDEDIVNSEGILHPIFNMSIKDINEVYKVNFRKSRISK